ncbi:MAG TPA: hypothetical protein VIL20_15330, partial [Sandaracinaceae bacterium]
MRGARARARRLRVRLRGPAVRTLELRGCQKSTAARKLALVLTPGQIVAGKYRVDRLLGAG